MQVVDGRVERVVLVGKKLVSRRRIAERRRLRRLVVVDIIVDIVVAGYLQGRYGHGGLSSYKPVS